MDGSGPVTSYSETSVQVQATNQQHGQLTDTRSSANRNGASVRRGWDLSADSIGGGGTRSSRVPIINIRGAAAEPWKYLSFNLFYFNLLAL